MSTAVGMPHVRKDKSAEQRGHEEPAQARVAADTALKVHGEQMLLGAGLQAQVREPLSEVVSVFDPILLARHQSAPDYGAGKTSVNVYTSAYHRKHTWCKTWT